MTGIDDRVRLRLVSVGVIVVLMFAALLTRLWFLQVLAGDDYAARAERNRVRLVVVEAPRGRILDRNGKVIVKNRTAWAVGIRADELPTDRAKRLTVKKRVGALLGMSVREIDRRLGDKRSSPYKPSVMATDVPQEVLFRIRERQEQYPGVETFALPVRTYPHGTLAAHLLGYVGEVNDDDIASSKGALRPGDRIGRTGVERTYDRWLRGEPGLDKLEVDATGRVLRSLGAQPPKPGADLVLALDLDAQKAAEKALVEGIKRARQRTFPETGARFRAPAGGIAIVDPVDGGVRVMASYPTFDPRKFVGGVSSSYWSYLNDPKNQYPLLNRAVQSAYPPGSTFKAITSVAALQSGVGSSSGSYPCTTVYRYGGRNFRNWKSRNASISIAQALIESCDTVFYRFGASWWATEQRAVARKQPLTEELQTWAERFGLGSPTGIDLPQETAGVVPGRESRKRFWEANKGSYCAQYERTGSALMKDLCRDGWRWRGGDAVNMSIGQGDLQTSVLQMAVAYAAVANGGDLLRPHLALRVVSPEGKTLHTVKRVATKVKARAGVMDYVDRALARVSEEGTAAFPYRGWPFERWRMAAKTGSAEIAGKQPFSWFASYGPVGRARYAAAAVVEQGGFGSQVAGPVVRRVMDSFFDLKPTPILIGGAAD